MTYKIIAQAFGRVHGSPQWRTSYGIPTFVLGRCDGFGPTSADEAAREAGRILTAANPHMNYSIGVSSEVGEYASLTVTNQE